MLVIYTFPGAYPGLRDARFSALGYSTIRLFYVLNYSIILYGILPLPTKQLGVSLNSFYIPAFSLLFCTFATFKTLKLLFKEKTLYEIRH